MWLRKKIVAFMLATAFIAPSALAWAETSDRSAYVYEPGYKSLYQNNPQIVNRYAGMSLSSQSMNQVSASGMRTAKSLIPGHIVDQYMRDSRPPINTAYTVKRGDTLYRIANLYGVSVDMLMLENRITDPTKLQIGQQLAVPAAGKDIAAWVANSSEVSDVFYATLTAYTAGYESTGKTPSHPEYGITASGAKVKENHTIAVDPDVIPLGTLVYIEGLGIRKAEDTGSAIKGHKIDVYIPDLEEALKFGVKKNVKVFVLGNEKKKNDVQIATAKP